MSWDDVESSAIPPRFVFFSFGPLDPSSVLSRPLPAANSQLQECRGLERLTRVNKQVSPVLTDSKNCP